MGLEPVVVNEVFREAVVVDDVAFRTDTEESTSGDIGRNPGLLGCSAERVRC